MPFYAKTDLILSNNKVIERGQKVDTDKIIKEKIGRTVLTTNTNNLSRVFDEQNMRADVVTVSNDDKFSELQEKQDAKIKALEKKIEDLIKQQEKGGK